MTVRRLLLALLVALVSASAAAARGTETPGVSAQTITIGGTAPLSGEASAAAAVSRGAQAYFEYVNSRDGVFGRKIAYKVVDDGYDPARTVEAARQLVQQEGVFAMFNTLGTSGSLAVRQYLNEQKVPQLFSLTGATTIAADHERYPYTLGFIPTYADEAAVLARHALQTRPNGRFAVLYQDDVYGDDMLAGLKRAFGKKAKQIVAAAGYDPTAADVQSQVAELKASRADTLFVFAFGKFAVQSFLYVNKLGWHPQIYLNAVASSANLMTLATITSSRRTTEGTISVGFTKDPNEPKLAKDPGMRLYLQIMKRFAPTANARDGYYLAGMSAAFALVDALRRAGKSPTRESLLAAATSLNETNNPFLVKGIAVRTSPTDYKPIEQMQLQRWQGGRWVAFGGLQTARSR